MTENNCSAGGSCGIVKLLLLGFVVLSIGAAVYKIAVAPVSKIRPTPAATASALNPPALTVKTSAEAKTAVVYYFYTNTRCSSCKKIEAYTREAVETNFTSAYKGWRVVFKGVNVEEEPDTHFAQDYFLDTKSVVVQKFSGDKTLKWVKLEKVWQLLDDKPAFMNYVIAETHKLLDEK